MSSNPASYQNLKKTGIQADFVIRHPQALPRWAVLFTKASFAVANSCNNT